MSNCPFKINLNTIKDLQLKACLTNIFKKILNEDGELNIPDNLVQLDPNTGKLPKDIIPDVESVPVVIDKVSTGTSSDIYTYESSTNTFTFDVNKGSNFVLESIDSSIQELNLGLENYSGVTEVTFVIDKPAGTTINLSNSDLIVGSTLMDDPDLIGPAGIYVIKLATIPSGIYLTSCYLISE